MNNPGWLISNKDLLSSLGSLTTIIFSIVGTIVAIMALRTWRREVVGKEKYEMGKNIRKALYHLKNLMDDRRLLTYGLKDNIYDDPTERIRVFSHTCADHFKRINDTIDILSATASDASHLKGPYLYESLIPLKMVIFFLKDAITDYKYTLKPDNNQKSKDRLDRALAIITDSDAPDAKKFAQDFDLEFGKLDNFIKKEFHL